MTAIDIGPPKVDLLRIRAGDRNQFIIKLRQNNKPFNLTGLTIEAQARHTPMDSEIAVTAVCTIIDAVGGQFELRWPGDEVRTILGTELQWAGVWDLQVSNGSDPQTLMAGAFTVEADVTR